MNCYTINFEFDLLCYLLPNKLTFENKIESHPIEITNPVAKRFIKRYSRYDMFNENKNIFIKNINFLDNKFKIHLVIRDWNDNDDTIIKNNKQFKEFLYENSWPSNNYDNNIEFQIGGDDYELILQDVENIKIYKEN